MPKTNLGSKLSSEESILVRETIRARGYTQVTIGGRLGYTSIESFRKVLYGSRTFPLEKRIKMYEILGKDSSLRFLVDFSGQEISDMISVGVMWERLSKIYGEVIDVYGHADTPIKVHILEDFEKLLKKYNPQNPS